MATLTVGTHSHRSDFIICHICADTDAVAVCNAHMIRMQQTESVRVATVSAHELDRKFQGVTSLQTCFPQPLQMAAAICGRIVAFYIVIED